MAVSIAGLGIAAWVLWGDVLGDVCVWTGTEVGVFLGGTFFGGCAAAAGAGLAIASARRLKAEGAEGLAMPLLVIGGFLIALAMGSLIGLADQMASCP